MKQSVARSHIFAFCGTLPFVCSIVWCACACVCVHDLSCVRCFISLVFLRWFASLVLHRLLSCVHSFSLSARVRSLFRYAYVCIDSVCFVFFFFINNVYIPTT